MPTSETECPFCRISRAADPDAIVVYADDDVIVFPPPEPATLGHMVLIPHEHVPNVWGLSVATAEALARTTLQVAEAVRTTVNPEGLSIIQSNGSAATQTVDHLHVHIVPRWSHDGIGPSWPSDTSTSEEDRRAVASGIRAHLERVEKPMADTSTIATSPEDRRKHLEFIQAVVTRMSASSATAKGWLLPVVTASYGYAITKNSAGVALLGIVATLVFSLMDANYLRQEKDYRALYVAVAQSTRPVPLFSLDLTHAIDPLPDSAGLNDRILKVLSRWLPGRSVWLSWSIAPFYTTFLAAGAVAVLAA